MSVPVGNRFVAKTKKEAADYNGSVVPANAAEIDFKAGSYYWREAFCAMYKALKEIRLFRGGAIAEICDEGLEKADKALKVEE